MYIFWVKNDDKWYLRVRCVRSRIKWRFLLTWHLQNLWVAAQRFNIRDKWSVDPVGIYQDKRTLIILPLPKPHPNKELFFRFLCVWSKPLRHSNWIFLSCNQSTHQTHTFLSLWIDFQNNPKVLRQIKEDTSLVIQIDTLSVEKPQWKDRYHHQ